LTHFHGRGGASATVGAGVDAKLVPCPAIPPARKIPAFVIKLRRVNNDDFSLLLSMIISFLYTLLCFMYFVTSCLFDGLNTRRTRGGVEPNLQKGYLKNISFNLIKPLYDLKWDFLIALAFIQI
jgi:hypothetical protein